MQFSDSIPILVSLFGCFGASRAKPRVGTSDMYLLP